MLMISPPLDMKEKWFAPHTAYTIAKFGMSLVVLGLAGELRSKGIAVNALWPRTVIATAAVQNLLGRRRIDAPFAQAGHHGRRRLRHIRSAGARIHRPLPDRRYVSGENGVTDFDKYRVDPTQKLAQDFFVPDDIPAPKSVILEAGFH